MRCFCHVRTLGQSILGVSKSYYLTMTRPVFLPFGSLLAFQPTRMRTFGISGDIGGSFGNNPPETVSFELRFAWAHGKNEVSLQQFSVFHDEEESEIVRFVPIQMKKGETPHFACRYQLFSSISARSS